MGTRLLHCPKHWSLKFHGVWCKFLEKWNDHFENVAFRRLCVAFVSYFSVKWSKFLKQFLSADVIVISFPYVPVDEAKSIFRLDCIFNNKI